MTAGSTLGTIKGRGKGELTEGGVTIIMEEGIGTVIGLSCGVAFPPHTSVSVRVCVHL